MILPLLLACACKAADEVTIVKTGEEFYDALVSNKALIKVVGHLNMDGLRGPPLLSYEMAIWVSSSPAF